jgi:sugar/nucleoside kinase (ribokinase family)
MKQTSLPLQVVNRLKGAKQILAESKALVGFDGFVDTILHVVDKRESATKFTRLPLMGEFASRIKAAAGLSANMEMVSEMVKLGGNGPIMANALGAYGAPITYIGNLGHPNLHPVFAKFAEKAKVYSIAEPGYTDAVEFEDGKLMFGKLDGLNQVTWANILKHVPENELLKIFSEASLISLVNWTMLSYMSAIFQKILAQIAPKLKGPKRHVFFDLADPAKRTRDDIAAALKLIAKFQKFFRVTLGLNLRESEQIGSVLGITLDGDAPAQVAEHAAKIRAALGIDTVVIHPTAFAAAADASSATFVDGPYTAKPKITTGAGDHFNAGFCVGRVLGCDLAESLQIGVGTSGFYVRNAKSPSLEDLKKFLKTL